jgi:hypothetical protein
MIGPHLHHALAALQDRDVVSLSLITEALSFDRPALRESTELPQLIQLGTRLPSGLIHAEEIWIVHEAPPGLAPLAPESPWYAMDRSLVAVIPPGRRALIGLLTDLAQYQLCAAAAAVRLQDRDDLIDALYGDSLEAAASTELAVLLRSPLDLVGMLDRRAPGLRSDLAGMARQSFDPRLYIHASLHPHRLKSKGLRLAEGLLARLPQGSFRLAVSDGTMLIEHLSPYVRDLGYALTAWGLENMSSLRTAGLADALAEGLERPSTDLAALVVQDLVTIAPDLVDERRRAEQTAGLHLWDDEGIVLGFADLGRLALPDEAAIAKNASGILAIVAGGADEILLEATRVLLESGRVTALSCVLSSALDVSVPILPDALLTLSDGIPVGAAADLADRANRLAIGVRRIGSIAVDESQGAPVLAAEILGQARRAQARGRLPREAPAFPVLYARPKPGAVAPLEVRLTEVAAGRLALAFLSSQEDPSPSMSGIRPMSQNAAGVSRRFRA